ncbi:MAG: hypothetical protein H6738_01335 [Alphaproteobacteria bacterium]|nr:hypothetical protein [Alphaproteobacteria bacterium]MCB9695410.1 hypothetical protein [Alphaproteobacteria bacterium]
MRTRFQLDMDEPDEFALTVPHGQREQRVMVRHFASWGRDIVELRSAFGELGDQDAEDMLRRVLAMPLGGIALHGRFLVVVHRECLDELSVEGVLYLISRIALIADGFEELDGADRF